MNIRAIFHNLISLQVTGKLELYIISSPGVKLTQKPRLDIMTSIAFTYLEEKYVGWYMVFNVQS